MQLVDAVASIVYTDRLLLALLANQQHDCVVSNLVPSRRELDLKRGSGNSIEKPAECRGHRVSPCLEVGRYLETER